MSIIDDPEFRAWELTARASTRKDPLWKFHAYRLSLFILTLAKRDFAILLKARPGSAVPDQLIRAVSSVSANIGEGIGRPTNVDRSRFIGFALGSLREAITWYTAAEGDLPEEISAARDYQLGELRRLLLGYQKWLNSRPKRDRLL